MQRGKFLTIEGTEGVGKSTNLAFVRDWLQAKGIEVIVTREPGGTPFAEEVRALLLAKRDESVNETAELLLVFAARAQHLAQIIKPALARGAWVLSDRFTDATYAYQGGGRGIPKKIIEQLEALVLPKFKPDYTLIFDAPADIGLQRVEARKAAQDRIEQEKIDFFERVRQSYLANAALDPKRYRIIDASKPLIEVQAAVALFLNTVLEAYHAKV